MGLEEIIRGVFGVEGDVIGVRLVYEEVEQVEERRVVFLLGFAKGLHAVKRSEGVEIENPLVLQRSYDAAHAEVAGFGGGGAVLKRAYRAEEVGVVVVRVVRGGGGGDGEGEGSGFGGV